MSARTRKRKASAKMPSIATKHQFYVKFDVNKPHHAEPYYQFELSCCREGSNGDKGFGWPGDNKIILLEGDNETYSKATIELITKQAALICKVLNRP